jgi:outer membrane biosynthesis protein TonB
MYFDFEDNHPDITPIGRAISWREGVLLSIIFHLVVIIGILLMPEFPGAEAARKRAEEAALMAAQQQAEAPRFVFVQPRLDTPAPTPPPPQADASDKDRVARAPERSPDPQNAMPFSRGNTPEPVEMPASPPPRQDTRADPGPAAEAAPNQPTERGQGGQNGSGTPGSSSLTLPGPPRPSARGEGTGAPGAPGVIGSALKNLQRYAPGEMFDNQQGGTGMFGPAIQFDTKGVEFGPWVRRFVAQIKRNWSIPYAAMAFRGHVVVTFNVHKNGAVTDLMVIGPCDVEAFNNSSYGALVASNPTYPLPPEYPADRAFFTVTFYYNEIPPR